ncbi:hypothetical protein OUZ56_018483 [Daphnia magna]|uniref:Secreted protein n=1 Tax=Daphnia magna TaxID=35525 RepID=A0ABQ9Z906_9CRUS|nr:hypothetical protein OUZ56_018483 [Daphnia magna]
MNKRTLPFTSAASILASWYALQRFPPCNAGVSPQSWGKACRTEFSALASTFIKQRSGDSLPIAASAKPVCQPCKTSAVQSSALFACSTNLEKLFSGKMGPAVIEDFFQLRLLSAHLTHHHHESTDFGLMLRQVPHGHI